MGIFYKIIIILALNLRFFEWFITKRTVCKSIFSDVLIIYCDSHSLFESNTIAYNNNYVSFSFLLKKLTVYLNFCCHESSHGYTARQNER